MNFNIVLNERIDKIKGILQKKGNEYSSNNDRFHNFNVAAGITGETPEKALLGMMLKQIVSVLDLIEWTGTGDPRLTEHMIDEKIGDNINYLILLEGMLRERLQKGAKATKVK